MAPSALDMVLDNWTSVFLTGVVCLALYVYFQWIQRSRGPVGIPYFGHCFFFSVENIHQELHEMSKKFGDVFCFTFSGQIYAHLGSWKAMREALVTKADCFARKSKSFSVIMDTLEGGVLSENGEIWKVLRRFFSQKLKDHGLGKNMQESLLGDNLHRIVEDVKKSCGRHIEALMFFTDNCMNAVNHLVFGPAPISEHDARRLAESFKIITVCTNGKNLLFSGAFFKYVMFPLMPSLKPYKKAKEDMVTILQRVFREHEERFDKDNIQNLVDCYIAERKALEQKGDPRSKIFSESGFVSTVLQIFGDGTASIGALCAEVVKEISARPHVQEKIQAEIDNAIGRERLPSWDDRSRMPYTIAVIYEVIRITLLVPFFPSLECTKETTVGGCRIPKGAVLLTHFYAALLDPEVYDQPEKFDPSRFFPGENKKPKEEIPNIFGLGKRSCIGEALTNMETFLFVTTVFQNFVVSPGISKGERSSEDWKVPIRAIYREP